MVQAKYVTELMGDDRKQVHVAVGGTGRSCRIDPPAIAGCVMIDPDRVAQRPAQRRTRESGDVIINTVYEGGVLGDQAILSPPCDCLPDDGLECRLRQHVARGLPPEDLALDVKSLRLGVDRQVAAGQNLFERLDAGPVTGEPQLAIIGCRLVSTYWSLRKDSLRPCCRSCVRFDLQTFRKGVPNVVTEGSGHHGCDCLEGQDGFVGRRASAGK